MHVHEARGDDQATRVNRARGGLRTEPPDGADQAAGNAHVGDEGRRTGPVNDQTIPEDHVQPHCLALLR